MPTSGEEPCRTARPCAAAAVTAGSQTAPPSTRTMPRDGSEIARFVVEALRGERPGVVAGALRGDPQPGPGGRPDDGRDLGGGARHGHGGGPLVDGDVPRHPQLVVRRVAAEGDLLG